jgi:hypothetical protein
MKADELVVPEKSCWRKIAITLIDLGFGEQTAQAGVNR